MPRYIGRRLDFLMTLTDTKNNALAKALNFDSSHISRIRRGERGVPHRRSFIEPAAAYFARHIREPWQIKAAQEAITPGFPWPEGEMEQIAAIEAWLSEEDTAPLFLNRSETQPSHTETPTRKNGKTFYPGKQGKRDAVERFLSEINEQPEPALLLLYSDEEMDWLTEDPAFALRWMTLMQTFLQKGGKIRIIHHLSRNIGEMLEAIQDWLPLYLAGNIEPWFCPRIRDGLFLHTLFIAKGIAAVTSSSVEGQSGEAASIFIENAEMVHSLEKEFDALIHLSRPLMQVHHPDSAIRFFRELNYFEQAENDLIALLDAPSPGTMPESAAASIFLRCESNWFEERWREASDQMSDLLKKGFQVTEILHLPNPAKVRAGEIPLPLSDFSGCPDLKYLPEEFIIHLESMLSLLRKQENYHVILSQEPSGVTILAKGATGALVFKSAPPSTAFVIREQSLTASIFEYLKRRTGGFDREKTILRLKEFLKEIQDEK